ncbi:NAD(P)-binding domain-containing protein [Amycolatopsis sp. NPDC059027]|uniref:NAD(P)-binding domain-containing protein n=1 Tax=unclassified Amycolatopsis TaxID=2618356 RepID=UPI003672DC3D
MTEHHKYIIVGAGPAGLQLGYFLERSGRDYLILERSARVGNFFHKYPIHRTLISINKKHNFFKEEEFNWRHDWNSLLSDDSRMRFTEYTDELFPDADVYCRYLSDFATRFSLRIRHQTEVTNISRPERDIFRLTTATGEVFTCDVLLLGLGAAEPMIPDEIEGIELATGYEDVTLDLEAYRNKRVGIIGQGNSAFETAKYIAGSAAIVNILAKGPIRFAWDTHYVGDLRAINNEIFDLYQLKSLNAVLSPRLRKIEQTPTGTLVTSHEYDYPTSSIPGTLQLDREYDIIIRCCGWRYVPESIFSPDVMPETWDRGKYPRLSPTWESANVRNLYFIGTAMNGNDKKSASGFIHGYRYNVQVLSRLLEERYEGVPYPRKIIEPFAWDTFADYLYERVSVTAALFQLFGTLCDVITVAGDGRLTIMQELPLAHADRMDFGEDHVFTLTLEFGFHHYSESAVQFLGPSDPNHPDCTAFLHPVIRYRRGTARDEFHFGDSLLARWDRPHGHGGAVVSYHLDFQRWMCGKLGIPAPQADARPDGPFRPWTPEEHAAWTAKENAAERDEPTCQKTLRTDAAPRRLDRAGDPRG